MLLHRIVSFLLGYPDATLRSALPEIAATLAAADLGGGERETLARFVDRLARSDAIAAEEAYVRTFDLVPEHSLHLTHHLLGEDRNRGPALIDMSEYYRAYCVDIAQNELPDYLPLMLEFASLLEEEEGRMFLSHWNKALRQLQANLAAAASPYAELVGLVERRSRLVAASGEVKTAPAEASDPMREDGDNDPPVVWSGPQGGACARPGPRP
ncbi:MAG TPA: nitrate reductase molybdenum cofactor assembly chaperone [Candidatus Desulfobacillus sp.]|nr:nitrate reductase molybdenum cofactor assembly chaperone [Candidatus Desulfobacillus sp.]